MISQWRFYVEVIAKASVCPNRSDRMTGSRRDAGPGRGRGRGRVDPRDSHRICICRFFLTLIHHLYAEARGASGRKLRGGCGHHL